MSTSNVIDPTEQPVGDLAALTKDLTEAVAAKAPTETGVTEESVQAELDANPLKGTKFEGKSTADVLEAYNNLQSAYGRQANDLGVQRQLSDRLLDLKRTDDLSSNSPEPVNIDSGKLIDDPTAVLNDLMDKRDERVTTNLDNRLGQIESSLKQQTFATKHPDYQQVGNDPKFVAWLQESPFRSRMAQVALGGDWQAADELLTEFKSVSAAPVGDTETTIVDAGDPNAEARKVALETTANANAGTTVVGKTYSRAALMRMRIEQPDLYEDPAFQTEIMSAYAQGRVK